MFVTLMVGLMFGAVSCAFTPKPIRGSGLLAARERRAARVAAEQKVMQQAKRRDGNQCRWPRCEYRRHNLPIDAAHVIVHRGAGGNPDGSRTQRALVAALCRKHHGLLDAALVQIEPLTDALMDGPCAFSVLNQETGRMEFVATETTIGVSVERVL